MICYIEIVSSVLLSLPHYIDRFAVYAGKCRVGLLFMNTPSSLDHHQAISIDCEELGWARYHVYEALRLYPDWGPLATPKYSPKQIKHYELQIINEVIYQLAMARYLQSRRIPFSYVAGISLGVFAGAYVCQAMTIAEVASMLASLLQDLRATRPGELYIIPNSIREPSSSQALGLQVAAVYAGYHVVGVLKNESSHLLPKKGTFQTGMEMLMHTKFVNPTHFIGCRAKSTEEWKPKLPFYTPVTKCKPEDDLGEAFWRDYMCSTHHVSTMMSSLPHAAANHKYAVAGYIGEIASIKSDLLSLNLKIVA